MPNNDLSRTDRVCDRLTKRKPAKWLILSGFAFLVAVAVIGTIVMYRADSVQWWQTAITSWLIVFVPGAYVIEALDIHRNAKCFADALNMIGIVGAATLQGISILIEAGAL